ncbi:MAG: hypothetical protein KJZ86_22680 [Caldilineaceae bacterium]|nr:hypothetical protein [Caldilineaceae bacterium]HRJ43051.1 hypothetical protein [Caldilineaceae bacterium]
MHTVTLPETVYNRLSAQAQASQRSIDELVVQSLLRTLPPPVEDDLPPRLQSELTAMENLSDDGLRQIAQSSMNTDKVALYDLLLGRNSAGELTLEGQEMLAQLRGDADELMLRKAHAFALLQSRGHRLPSLSDLHRAARG